MSVAAPSESSEASDERHRHPQKVRTSLKPPERVRNPFVAGKHGNCEIRKLLPRNDLQIVENRESTCSVRDTQFTRRRVSSPQMQVAQELSDTAGTPGGAGSRSQKLQKIDYGSADLRKASRAAGSKEMKRSRSATGSSSRKTGAVR